MPFVFMSATNGLGRVDLEGGPYCQHARKYVDDDHRDKAAQRVPRLKEYVVRKYRRPECGRYFPRNETDDTEHNGLLEYHHRDRSCSSCL